MTDAHLTRVELVFYPEHTNHWLYFGNPVRRLILDTRRHIALFAPGQVFGYVRWHANEYGTQDWRLAVLQAGAPADLLSPAPGVVPGADVLLLAIGKARVKRAMAVLDTLKSQGFALEEISPAYYRHVHVRLATGRDVRPYSEAQHAAHLATKRVR